ncbi:heavy-metal-associated domain-containing protein [Lentimicrobium sp. S6]|uniref:heavy-metal-associated domain-containing protein n=1 Tax=Lentimicrobium sp. S6 TaxID=2735872 RepID=UPI0015578EC1|nr:heavy metal-associated domain-containing protein [Lentimicrobium sp. S6]NPD44696.1 heavy-metal-associated domain-containing protein [Lentimicrobium sp. S6]
MVAEIFVENIKCNGCKNTIIKEVKKQEKVSQVEVEIETGKITLEFEGKDTVARIKSKLKRKGYPEKGKNNIKSTVVSYASCAIGRINGPTKYQVKNFDVAED